jgi:hypothetical protein
MASITFGEMANCNCWEAHLAIHYFPGRSLRNKFKIAASERWRFDVYTFDDIKQIKNNAWPQSYEAALGTCVEATKTTKCKAEVCTVEKFSSIFELNGKYIATL